MKNIFFLHNVEIINDLEGIWDNTYFMSIPIYNEISKSFTKINIQYKQEFNRNISENTFEKSW